MSSCCDPGNGFPDAGLSVQLGRNHAVIWSEICAIQQAILKTFCGCDADCIGCGADSRCVQVAGDTPMTFVTSVESIVVVSGGSGYINPITTVIDEYGSGVETETILTNDVITQVNIVKGGANYTQSATASALPDLGNTNPIVDAVFSVTVRKNPWCTNPESYYKVINQQCENRSTQDQIDQVTTYFKKLGYEIDPLTNPDTGNTIMWRVCW